MPETLANSIRLRLKKVSRAEFLSVAALSVCVSLMAATWVAYRIGYFDAQVKCGYPCIGSGHRDVFVDAMRMRIAIALAITAVGICARKAFSFFMSLLSLSLLELQYILWYVWSNRWLRETGLDGFSNLPPETDIPHALGLYGGSPLDVFVFGIATALLVWQLRLLLGANQMRREAAKREHKQS